MSGGSQPRLARVPLAVLLSRAHALVLLLCLLLSARADHLRGSVRPRAVHGGRQLVGWLVQEHCSCTGTMGTVSLHTHLAHHSIVAKTHSRASIRSPSCLPVYLRAAASSRHGAVICVLRCCCCCGCSPQPLRLRVVRGGLPALPPPGQGVRAVEAARTCSGAQRAACGLRRTTEERSVQPHEAHPMFRAHQQRGSSDSVHVESSAKHGMRSKSMTTLRCCTQEGGTRRL